MKNFQNHSLDVESKNLALDAPKVTEYMTSKLITFTPQTEISVAITSLLTNKITGAPVLDENGKVLGMIDDKDCLNVLVSGAYNNHPTARDTVANYMSDVLRTITVNANIIEVAEIFISTKYKRLLVMDKDGQLAGQISRRDILRAIADLNANTW